MLLSESLIQGSVGRYKAQRIHARRGASALADGPRRSQFNESRRRQLYRQIVGTVHDPQQAARTFERIIAGNDLVGINYLGLGLRAARSVGRMHLRDAAGRLVGYGTGFLVGPGIVMTNNHVIGSDLDAATALIEFDYELDNDGQDRPTVTFALDASQGFITDRRLDFTVVGVAAASVDGRRKLDDFGWLPLRPRPGKAFEGEYLTIIQHPGGERKQVCVRENKLLKYADDTLWYETDTVAGSSGSPVFNGFWEVVALHHSGIPATDKQGRYLAIDGRPWDSSMDETRIKWIANEGIRISRIVEFLRTAHGAEPIAQRVVAASDAPHPAVETNDVRERAGGPAPSTTLSTTDGALTVTLPIVLSVRLGADALSGAQRAVLPVGGGSRAAPAADDAGAIALGIEKVVVDQTNYKIRKGYDPHFLGDAAVPLPKLSATLKKQAVKLIKDATDDPTLLNYYNYSVVMSGPRRLAIYAAANINGPQRRDTGKRDGDRWYIDPRIPAKFQVGEDFYASVLLDEAKRTRVFDRGHLVRRLDTTWGATAADAKRSGDDTFHFTNCTPQHWQFNEGAKLWAGIEDYVLFEIENDQRLACVINGPVFRNDDDERSGVKIPKQFFKIVAFIKNGALVAAGFVLSQADLLKQDLPAEELKPLTDQAAALFQVKLSNIAKMTGLDFGPLVQHDAAMSAFEAKRRAQPLRSLDDMTV